MACRTVCNVCGKEFDIFDEQEDFTLKRKLGYGTKRDGDKLSLHFCCECMDKLIDSCKVSPIIPEEPEQISMDLELLDEMKNLIDGNTYTENE